MTSQHNVGIVVIGRNEGERLKVCLRSVVGRARAVVYVDSGSTDGSVPFGRSVGVDVVELDTSVQFTAARARNAGLAHLLKRDPHLRIVQFVDGDCELAEGWIERGVVELATQANVAVVFGRVCERFRGKSIYNRLCDIEWNTPFGEVEGCGGVALMRLDAVREVAFFDPAVIAAEDTELCVRMRSRGWKILHIDVAMAQHDADMWRFTQWWRRNVRAGYGFAQVDAKHRGFPSQPFRRQRRSVWTWGGALPAVALALAWPTRGWSLSLFCAYAFLAYRVYRGTRTRALSASDRSLYAAHCVFAKIPQMIGELTYHLHRASGKTPILIEHKRSRAASAALPGEPRALGPGEHTPAEGRT